MKKKPSILHICPDEKFIDGIIHLFEKAFPSANSYLVLLSPANPPLKYITNLNIPIKKIVYGKKSLEEIKEIELKHDFVILHGLNYRIADLVISTPIKEKYVWSVLGAELYQNSLLYNRPLLGEKSRILEISLRKGTSIKESLKNIYRKFRYRNLPKIDNSQQLVAEAASQITRFASLVREEYDYLQDNKLISKNATFQPITYYPIEYFEASSDLISTPQPNLLIGNSASITNNHIEVFDLLSSMSLGDRRIIVPISYGVKKYQHYIVKIGEGLFGDKFLPLINYLELSEYNKVVSSCGILIMNHYRQQGVGNILQSFWQGRKVFLSEKNVLFKYFVRLGCVVYSIENDLNKNNHEVFTPLSEKELEQNRRVLRSEISEEVLVEKLRIGFNIPTV